MLHSMGVQAFLQTGQFHSIKLYNEPRFLLYQHKPYNVVDFQQLNTFFWRSIFKRAKFLGHVVQKDAVF